MPEENMRKIQIDYAKPGMILARSIFTSDGNVLLGCGVRLNQRYIDRLKEKGIYHIYIEDELSQGIEIIDVITDETRIKAKEIVRSVMFDIAKGYEISDAYQVTKIVNQIVDELLENKDVLVNLNDMRLMDDYTFGHCVNVCVLSVMTGIAMGYNQLRLRELGVGALLHDIGKMKIPISLLNKPGQLTDDEYNEIKRHTILGFDILRNCDAISKTSANTALAHHERCDGTGYPNGLMKDQIHDFSKIVAIADVYDAMTSDRAYRKALEPYKAVEYIQGMSMTQFDYNVVKVFIGNISIYPVGSGVVLNTGEKGLVVKVNKEFPTRPRVRIILDKNGCRYDRFEEIDLLQHPTIFITSTCNDLV